MTDIWDYIWLTGQIVDIVFKVYLLKIMSLWIVWRTEK